MPKPRVLLVPMLVAAWACVLSTARSFAAAGCTPGGAPAPPGAGMRQVGDLDRDGGPDTLWVARFRDGNGRTDRVVGTTTASGANSDVQVLSASPMPLVALAIDAQNGGGNQIIVSDGRSARLYTFAECGLQTVVDSQGARFLFDLQNLRDHSRGRLQQSRPALLGSPPGSAETSSCGDLIIGKDGVQQP